MFVCLFIRSVCFFVGTVHDSSTRTITNALTAGRIAHAGYKRTNKQTNKQQTNKQRLLTNKQTYKQASKQTNRQAFERLTHSKPQRAVAAHHNP